MRFAYRTTKVVWMGLLFLGCNRPRICEQPLESYCSGPCPTLEEAIEQAKASDGPLEENVTVEQCDTAYTRIHYVDIGNLYGMVEYFDASGQLVGAAMADDNDGECDGVYGELPECEPQCVVTYIPYCEEPCEPPPNTDPCE